MARGSFRAYLEQYNQLEGNVKQMEELLESTHGQLNKYADTVAERGRKMLEHSANKRNTEAQRIEPVILNK